MNLVVEGKGEMTGVGLPWNFSVYLLDDKCAEFLTHCFQLNDCFLKLCVCLKGRLISRKYFCL